MLYLKSSNIFKKYFQNFNYCEIHDLIENADKAKSILSVAVFETAISTGFSLE